MDTPEFHRQNIEIVGQIRESLKPLAERLGPEVEPALVFTLQVCEAEETPE